MSDYSAGRNARTVYEKWRQGDSLTDTELLRAVQYWKITADMLTPLGDTFRLAANEANRCFLALDGFVSARGLDKTQNP